jgi:hypothetical protein
MLKFSVMMIPIFFASVFGFFGEKMNPYEKNEKLMSQIISTSVKQLSNRYGLVQMGIGGAEKEGKSKREYVGFQIYKKLTKEEARILMVEIVELFLHNINKTKSVSHYLSDNPFTYKNLEFTVIAFNPDGSDVYQPDIGLVSLTRRGTITYVTYKPGTKSEYASEIEEPYEEAYRIATQRQR